MDLFDLIVGVLQLVFVFTAKFWPVIIAVLAYKLFGLGRSKQGKPKEWRDVLTPVHGGGHPKRRSAQGELMRQPAQQPMKRQTVSAEAERTRETDRNVSHDSLNRSEEVATISSDIVPVSPSYVADDSPSASAPVVTIEPQSSIDTRDPREGMKWALIFSPPRGKARYAPPYLSARNDN